MRFPNLRFPVGDKVDFVIPFAMRRELLVGSFFKDVGILLERSFPNVLYGKDFFILEIFDGPSGSCVFFGLYLLSKLLNGVGSRVLSVC